MAESQYVVGQRPRIMRQMPRVAFSHCNACSYTEEERKGDSGVFSSK